MPVSTVAVGEGTVASTFHTTAKQCDRQGGCGRLTRNRARRLRKANGASNAVGDTDAAALPVALRPSKIN